MEDKIEKLISKMNSYAMSQEYEKAQEAMGEIKSELDKPVNLAEKYGTTFEDFLNATHTTTVKDVYDLITGNSIRLSPQNYSFSQLLSLTIAVHKRKNELTTTDKERQIVAEEMACIGMTVPASHKGKKPNRAFLDIAAKVNPSLSCQEIARREKVKLWKAIEKGNPNEIERIKKEIRKYSQRDD